MRTYGAPESNAYEGLALFGLYAGSSLVVAGWAYATDFLQVVLVILGIAVLAGSVFCMIQSRSVGTGK
jgi:hypothetical protein